MAYFRSKYAERLLKLHNRGPDRYLLDGSSYDMTGLIQAALQDARELQDAVKSLHVTVPQPNSTSVHVLVAVDEIRSLFLKSIYQTCRTSFEAFEWAMMTLNTVPGLFFVTIDSKMDLSRPFTSLLHAPYTELPFDCLPDGKPFAKSGTLKRLDVARIGFMVKFGRPLYGSTFLRTVMYVNSRY